MIKHREITEVTCMKCSTKSIDLLGCGWCEIEQGMNIDRAEFERTWSDFYEGKPFTRREQ